MFVQAGLVQIGLRFLIRGRDGLFDLVGSLALSWSGLAHEVRGVLLELAALALSLVVIDAVESGPGVRHITNIWLVFFNGWLAAFLNLFEFVTHRQPSAPKEPASISLHARREGVAGHVSIWFGALSGL